MTWFWILIGIFGVCFVVSVIVFLLMLWGMYDDRGCEILDKIGIAKLLFWIEKQKNKKKKTKRKKQ